MPGSGILRTHFSAGARIPLRDAVQLMIAYSDNTATNLVLDTIGLEETCASMKQLGLTETRINAKVFRRDTSIDPERSREYGLGSTTARETLTLLKLLHRRELVSKKASEQMLQHLRSCEDDTKLTALLPEGVVVAHKGGSVADVRCSAGIIETEAGPIAVCVLTAGNSDRSWTNNEANRLCARVGRRAYDFFNPPWKEGITARPGPLQEGSGGVLVENLQRTLNARMNPSPELSIDGEFGPVTRAAVARFQESKQLDATGIVNEATWEALGPLVTRSQPVPPPEEVNAQELETQPGDEINGRPFVTCRAWAIADVETGEFLWGENESLPLDFASTTKIMTAWLVVRLAETDPEVLDERITFSRRADETPGSTAGIRTGEQIPVGEALYGLLLPSGNDASVALAEHFGARLRADAVQDEEGSSNGNAEHDDPLKLFVSAMNREASRLGMKETHYENPHGLTAGGHVASARDLLKLASTAMKSELFSRYVATRRRGCLVHGPGGYTRNVLWKNTNQLLEIEGYAGVKTGTTSAAGACLVSLARRRDETLMLVVLGSAASRARYTDSRNLYRWAWQQRALESAPQPAK